MFASKMVIFVVFLAQIQIFSFEDVISEVGNTYSDVSLKKTDKISYYYVAFRNKKFLHDFQFSQIVNY